ncbi:hypothetical protein DFS34DRAFT_653124 [Phlyctochytrium arcticum]|nr:hypothetical protein DFS34DRAFT_653124 [Phlyctochytrium arcticum]
MPDLQEEARKRKERLRALRNNAQSTLQEEPLTDKTVEEQAAQLAKETLEASKAAESTTLQLPELVPKSVNWDLERDLETRMEPLDLVTQTCITALLRQRLSSTMEEF